jgi:hypothetical protein
MAHTNGNLFIGDVQSHSILVYSLESDWAFVRAIGSKGKGAGQFDTPMGMCVYRDWLIVCDCQNDRLQFIDMSAADAKDWRFDEPFGSYGTASGQFKYPFDVCHSTGVLFVSEQAADVNRVQTFTIAVNAAAATSALTLTPRSIIRGLDKPWSLAGTPDASRVFVTDNKQISCIDVVSGAVRPFVGIAEVDAICLADGLLYAVHDEGLSVVHADSGVIQQSAIRTLHGRSWVSATGIAVLPDFVCVSENDRALSCVHVIPRS